MDPLRLAPHSRKAVPGSEQKLPCTPGHAMAVKSGMHLDWSCCTRLGVRWCMHAWTGCQKRRAARPVAMPRAPPSGLRRAVSLAIANPVQLLRILARYRAVAFSASKHPFATVSKRAVPVHVRLTALFTQHG